MRRKIKMANTTISVSDFINTKYRDYWIYSNRNGKNSIEPREQLPEVVRKIIFAAYKINIKEIAIDPQPFLFIFPLIPKLESVSSKLL